MTPLVVITLIAEILRLVNNLLDGTAVEQRQAQARIWFDVTYPVVERFLPEKTRARVRELMHGEPQGQQ